LPALPTQVIAEYCRLRGGFEMDRKGNWRLKPQVADTLERDHRADRMATPQAVTALNAQLQVAVREMVDGKFSIA